MAQPVAVIIAPVNRNHSAATFHKLGDEILCNVAEVLWPWSGADDSLHQIGIGFGVGIDLTEMSILLGFSTEDHFIMIIMFPHLLTIFRGYLPALKQILSLYSKA